jgi:hypothetical protein
MKRITLLAVLALAACSPKAPEAPAPQSAAEPADLKALEQAHDWQHEPGEALNKAWNDQSKAILMKLTRADAIKLINDAGFECTYGEAHQDYPDPMAVCTRSFATRSCQMDWEVWSTADKGHTNDAGGDFKRDCVGVTDDWPEPIKSAIDNQLAPQTPPEPAKPN